MKALPPIEYREWKATLPPRGQDWAELENFNSMCDRSLSEHLQPLRSRGKLAPGEIGVICVLRNEAERLPLFFDHYKKLGASRFFMVDNDSTDGSLEQLMAEPLADVFFTRASFAQACSGMYWCSGVARAFCRGNWIVVADADELLVYDGMENHDLSELARWHDGQGLDRLFAIMLDVYPSSPLGVKSRSIEDILASDCWFDSDGYTLNRRAFGWTIYGGARHRLFEQKPGASHAPISKYPFIRMGTETTLVNNHYLWPYDKDTRGPLAVFLHLKLTDDFVTRSRRNARECEHWNNAQHYREIVEQLGDHENIIAFCERSRRYRGPRSLVERNVMFPIDWEAPAGKPRAEASRLHPAIFQRDWLKELPLRGKQWEARGEFNELSHLALTEHLTLVRDNGEPSLDDICLISVLRNEAERLPLFFEHYKKLGVTRFLMVDNDSSDGSHELLLAEPRADVYFTRARYSDALRGIYWCNGIAQTRCRNRWILRADIDELLVYDGMETHDIRALAAWLERQGLDRLFSLMIDVYPSGALGTARRPIAEILKSDCWFDSDRYSLQETRGGVLITGGPRQRLFGTHDHWLSKYPFFRMGEDTVLLDAHFLWPPNEKSSAPMSGLLHLKLMDDFIERSARFEREGQHAVDSRAYRTANQTLASNPALTAFHPGSRRYKGPKSLIRHEMILPIDWEDRQPGADLRFGERHEKIEPNAGFDAPGR